MLYEDQTKDPTSDDRFHVELHFSPGVSCCLQKNLPIGPGFRTQTARTVHAKVTYGVAFWCLVAHKRSIYTPPLLPPHQEQNHRTCRICCRKYNFLILLLPLLTLICSLFPCFAATAPPLSCLANHTSMNQKHFGASKSVDKVLLSSSLPKPSSIKEEEVGDFSDISVEDDAESSSTSDVFVGQQQRQQHTHQPSPKVVICKKSPHYSLASKSMETTLCSSPVSSQFAIFNPSFCLNL